ncbi:MAG: BolA family protein [Alphaproteobacteria bacterium]
MSVRTTIADTLTRSLAPEALDVIDESHLHEGHAGARPEGKTHFRIHIVSKAFIGKSRIDRHRLVNDALAQELAGPIHALAIRAQAPDEAE